jgi:hypothetical protein
MVLGIHRAFTTRIICNKIASPFAKCERVLYYRSGGKSPALGRRGMANKCVAKRIQLIYQKLNVEKEQMSY